MSVQINALLREELVLLDVEPADHCEAFHIAIKALTEHHLFDPSLEEDLYSAICDREDLSGTGVGHGVALPHAYAKGLREPLIVVLRSKTDLDFDRPDEVPVDLMLLLVGPRRDDVEHLRIIAKLSRLLRDPEMTRRLRSAKKPVELLEAVREIEKRH